MTPAPLVAKQAECPCSALKVTELPTIALFTVPERAAPRSGTREDFKPNNRYLGLALQLHFRFKMGAACFGLVSSSPE
jgi:hypothetical protein